MAASGPWGDCTIDKEGRMQKVECRSKTPDGLLLLGSDFLLLHSRYSPPTVNPSIRIVGQAMAPRNSKSLPISEMLKRSCFRLPATVISSTGYVSSPWEIQRPEAPRE